MDNKININNPFEESDGGPVSGKVKEFFAFAREQELKRRSALPLSEQEKLKEADSHMAKKMNS
ncbi:MAG TPA: hypothetical protein VGP43_02525 [Chitinophagaceae bacterium]|nr:hypothetical protein [Chitinophagaceae bacterium]